MRSLTFVFSITVIFLSFNSSFASFKKAKEQVRENLKFHISKMSNKVPLGKAKLMRVIGSESTYQVVMKVKSRWRAVGFADITCSLRNCQLTQLYIKQKELPTHIYKSKRKIADIMAQIAIRNHFHRVKHGPRFSGVRALALESITYHHQANKRITVISFPLEGTIHGGPIKSVRAINIGDVEFTCYRNSCRLKKIHFMSAIPKAFAYVRRNKVVARRCAKGTGVVILLGYDLNQNDKPDRGEVTQKLKKCWKYPGSREEWNSFYQKLRPYYHEE